MQGSSQSSFIPKRNPVKKTRKAVSRRIYTVTIISYILLFSTLLAAAGVFVYKLYVERQLEDEIAALSAEIDRFDNSDLQRAKDFDARLSLASDRVGHSVSLASLFTAMEQATIGTVAFEKFSLTRNLDDDLAVQIAVRTDSFDSSIFQRGVFMRDGVVADVEIENLQKVGTATQDDGAAVSGSTDNTVTFDATIGVGLDAIPYDPTEVVESVTTIVPVESEVASSTVGTSTNVTDI